MSRQLITVCFLTAALFCVSNSSYNQAAPSLDATFKLFPEVGQALLNDIVTFSCSADAKHINFAIDDETVHDSPNNNNWDLEECRCTYNEIRYKRLRMFLKARAIFNNSNISCYTSNEGELDFSSLEIQGLLASVGDLTYTFLNSSSVQLTWTPPYTLDNVPITGYYIEIVNSASTVNLTVSSTNAIILTDPDPCTLTTVSVSPENRAGRGQAANVSFYYQTVSNYNSRLMQIDSTLVPWEGTVNATLIFSNNFSSFDNEVNITIKEKLYTRNLDENLAIESPIPLPSENLICVSVEVEGGNFEGIINIPTVDYQSQCINCAMFSSDSTDQGCQVNLAANGESLFSVQFIRRPHTSLMAGGCIPPDAINIACYDVDINVIKEDGSLSFESFKFLKKIDNNCDITSDSWPWYATCIVAGIITIGVVVAFVVAIQLLIAWLRQDEKNIDGKIGSYNVN